MPSRRMLPMTPGPVTAGEAAVCPGRKRSIIVPWKPFMTGFSIIIRRWPLTWRRPAALWSVAPPPVMWLTCWKVSPKRCCWTAGGAAIAASSMRLFSVRNPNAPSISGTAPAAAAGRADARSFRKSRASGSGPIGGWHRPIVWRKCPPNASPPECGPLTAPRPGSIFI